MKDFRLLVPGQLPGGLPHRRCNLLGIVLFSVNHGTANRFELFFFLVGKLFRLNLKLEVCTVVFEGTWGRNMRGWIQYSYCKSSRYKTKR